jgi:ABC-2 type transport system permease protein
MKPTALRWPMQVVAFMGKELADLVRQPRTLIVMVIGPFAVLALFGVGYRDAPPALATAFVVDPSSPLRAEVERYVEEFDDAVDVRGIFDSPDEARTLLRNGDVDLVVAFPDDPIADVESGQRSILAVSHTRLDPIEQTAIAFVSQLAVDEINAAILSGLLDAGRDELLGAVDSVVDADQVASAAAALDVRFVDALLTADTEVFVRPLDRTVELAVDDVDDVTDWYAPAAVVLMLQQFGVVFGSLSLVRERHLGINEVYRIAPVSGGSSVTGKYLAYLLVGAAVATVLVALVVGALGVPIAGGLGEIAVVMGLTVLASTGLGFVISLVAKTDVQAIQYTMIVLLASLFFSGFFLSLDQLGGPSRFVAALLPASYAMELLRDSMLRDAGLETTALIGLAAYATVGAVIAVVGARRQMREAS